MSRAATGKPLFRADLVGSLLRPSGLKDACRALAEAALSAEAFETTLDAEIGRAVARPGGHPASGDSLMPIFRLDRLAGNNRLSDNRF